MTDTTPRDPWFAPVLARPLAVAAVTVLVAALLVFRLGLRADLAAYLVLAVIGTMLAFIDAATMRLPDQLTLPGAAAVAGLLALAALDLGWNRLLFALGGAVALFLYFGIQWFIVPRMLGLGDVKMALALGLALGWLGLGAFIAGVFLMHMTFFVWALGVLVAGRARFGMSLPFGPFMLAGTLIGVLVYA